MCLKLPGKSALRALAALFLIAASAYSINARAQNIYKCGNTYSSTACPEGRALDLSDERTPAQKQQTQAAARQDAQQADTLEKERLALEKAALKQPPSPTSTQHAVTPSKTAPVITQITPKRLKRPGKKPEAFIAEIPGTEKKPKVKKVVKKKQAAVN
ncbi:MAG: hypothetical protein FD135_1867 [Comamonadaceae bacterium]|nr:MAG: hypothetical protein FD135_1867 [Comamonadaceae bacterium]